jgi:hypothetical protein
MSLRPLDVHPPDRAHGIETILSLHRNEPQGFSCTAEKKSARAKTP